MKSQEWTLPTTPGEAYHRAGGRRRYNAQRQALANNRRLKLADLVKSGMTNAQAARALGVHRSTIGRDLQSSLYFEILGLPRKLAELLEEIKRRGEAAAQVSRH